MNNNQEKSITLMKELIGRFDLNPMILSTLENGQRMFSLATEAFGDPLDVIKKGSDLGKIVTKFEQTHDACVVYHVVITSCLISLLFTSGKEDEDDEPEIMFDDEGGAYVLAYVYNILEPSASEIGDVYLVPYQGRLIRVI